jgi:hypothetical protein
VGTLACPYSTTHFRTPMPDEPGPNNRRIAERLDRHLDLITRARKDPEATALLAERGYDDARMDEGLALHAAAQDAFTNRDRTSGARSTLASATKKADRDARRALAEVRNTLRALYDGQPGILEELGVARDEPAGDRNTFLTESRGTLATVRTAPYAADAAEAGLTSKKLDAADTAIEALATSAGDLSTSGGVRKGATTTRNVAFDDFQTWVSRFRRFSRIAYRDHPAVAERVGM